MTIKKVNAFHGGQLTVEYFCYNWFRLEQVYMKLIDGVVHQTASNGYMWTPSTKETNLEVLREFKRGCTLVNGALHSNDRFLCNVAKKHTTVESAVEWYLTPIVECDEIDYEQQEINYLQDEY